MSTKLATDAGIPNVGVWDRDRDIRLARGYVGISRETGENKAVSNFLECKWT